MKKYLIGFCFVLLAAVAVAPTTTRAETASTTSSSSISSLLQVLQDLMKQVADLQKKLADVKAEIREELGDNLKEGMTDEDIAKIQELLATDPNIYPKGIITGYYGPLTKEAIKRFQTRHGLEATGEVDAETKALFLEYFKEKSGGKIPAGLLRAPGIDKKILERLREDADGKKYLDCDDSEGAGPLCKEWRNWDVSTGSSSKEVRAENALEAAGIAIDDLADSGYDREALDTKLEKAMNAFDAGNYRLALSLALSILKIADEELDEDELEDEDEDEDEDDE